MPSEWSRLHRAGRRRQARIVVARDAWRVDDEIETAIFQDRRRQHFDAGRFSLDGLSRAGETAGIARKIVHDDKLGARRAEAPGKTLTFHASPKDTRPRLPASAATPPISGTPRSYTGMRAAEAYRDRAEVALRSSHNRVVGDRRVETMISAAAVAATCRQLADPS